MPLAKIDRALQLRKEDIRNKSYNIISGIPEVESKWISAFEPQTNKNDHWTSSLKL
jgi:hypothetical protein